MSLIDLLLYGNNLPEGLPGYLGELQLIFTPINESVVDVDTICEELTLLESDYPKVEFQHHMTRSLSVPVSVKARDLRQMDSTGGY